jgi:Bacteriophage tail sheath protein
MATTPTYPGVYIEEVSSGVRTITGVATSITAFVGFARRGTLNEPRLVQSFAEFERSFGRLWSLSTMSYAVYQYFQNGGRDALIVRTARVTGASADRAKKSRFPAGPGTPDYEAASEGVWGDQLRVRIDHDVDPDKPGTFNLFVKDLESQQTEVFRNLSVTATDPNYVARVLENQSRLLRTPSVPGAAPAASGAPAATATDPFDDPSSIALAGGADGVRAVTDLIPASATGKTGIYALDKADLFNLLCVPPVTRDGNLTATTISAASKYCADRRALLIVDPNTAWDEPSDMLPGGTGPALDTATSGITKKNAAIYFPRIRATDPELDGALDLFPPCGAVAGIMARTDAERGVWKAPAGQEATISGATGLAVALTDGENGQLNPRGVNCLRTFPVIGNVVWGARTMDGADALASEWKYVPVRRLALFLEESLYRGTKWVVFEPNDEPLWAQIRLNVGAFMQNLFRQGAFQGTTPREAYFVKCDKETTTQNDINLGIVNILVGFAPLKPAEFVIVRIQQMAGQVAV